MINLYDFQETLGVEARVSLRDHRSTLVVLPTGGGKSYITAWMVKNGLAKGNTFYFCVHRRDLLTQMASTFKDFGIPFGYIAAGRTYNPTMPVQICSIQTLARRLDKIPAPSVLIVDEAHFSCSPTYSDIIDEYKKQGAFVIGKTATPWRMSGEGLGRHFKDMVQGPTVRELMDKGFLSKYKIYAPSTPVLDKVHVKAGDYVEKELESLMDRPTITGNAVDHYIKHAMNKKTVAFCVSIKHSENVAASFCANGIVAQHVDYKTKPEARARIFKAFADGHIKILTSVSIFSEGLDLASLVGQDVCIEAAILLRPTKSLSMYLQQCGRALRKKNTHAVILDHAGNCKQHGLPDQDRDWTLSDRKKSKKKDVSAEKDERVKQCPECYFVHEPASSCPDCGHIYETADREIEQVDGDLEEIDIEAARKAKKKEQSGAGSLDQLIALGASRGYKNPVAWARHVYNARVAKGMMR
jgi:DNA repair protein RadD